MIKLKVIENPALSVSEPSAADDYGESGVRPSVFYFRKALRESWSRDRAVDVGLVVCRELEHLKAWVEEQGFIPPKWIVSNEEAREKNYELA